MGESAAIALISSIAGTLFITISAILGWLGARVIAKLDELDTKLDALNIDMVRNINAVDHRVTILEVLSE